MRGHRPGGTDNTYGKRTNKTILFNTALKLYKAGFNIVPIRIVGESKKPISPTWSSRKRISEEELRSLLPLATGIAIVGGTENPFKPTAVVFSIDVDKPREVQKRYPYLYSKVEEARAFKWFTGPRCPKCEEKHLDIIEYGKVFRCPKCNIEFTIEEAGRGIGVLASMDLDTYKKYFEEKRIGTIRREIVEILVNNYQLIPPSLHPTGVRYEWISPPDFDAANYGIIPLEEYDIKRILEEFNVLKSSIEEEKREEKVVVAKTTPLTERGRDLKDEECLKIYTLLSDAYKPGYRDLIILFLTGWLRRANISYKSARRVVELLAKDDEELESRIYVLDRTYGLRGNPPTKEELKGKSGLLEVLTDIIGEEKALEVIKELENILGTASPYADAIIELLDYDKQIYGVCNFRRLIIARARRTENGFRYMERITIGAPTKLIVYFNPLGGLTKYEVLWESETRRPLRIGPCNIEDIAGRLRAEGLVLHPRLLEGVLNAIFEAFLRRGRAEIKEEIEAPGFYYIDDKIVEVRYEIEDVDLEELRNALELLDTLSYWYSHALDRFSIIIKWGLIAPFVYARKQRGKWIPWLYLYGSSYTGKTTLAFIVLHLYGLPIAQYQKSGSNIDTVPRLGYVLSRATFPTLINEPGSAITKEQIIEVMKSAIESTTARGRYVRGTYTEIPSLSPLIMTSNKILPRDDALLRRFIVLLFTYGERISKEKSQEFDRTIKPRFRELEVIGKWVAKRIIEDPSILNEDDWLAIAERLLTEMYESVGLTPPEWIKLRVEEEEDIYEDMREMIREHLRKRVEEEFIKFSGRVLVEATVRPRTDTSFEERLNIVLSNGLIPYIIYRDDGTIIFTIGFREELRSVIGDIGGLKSIAELLGWEYKLVKIKGRVMKAITTKYESLVEFLS